MQNPQSIDIGKSNRGITSFQIQIPKNALNSKNRKGSFLPATESYVYPDRMWKVVGMLMIVCICPFYAGVNIFISYTATFQTYQKYYNFTYYPVVTSNIISGCVPAGGVFGSIIFPIVIKRIGKMNLIALNLIGTIIFAGLTLVPVYEVLIVGRFCLGMLSSWQNVLAALLIRDLSPLQYRAFFRAMFYVSRASGLTFCLVIGAFNNYDISSLRLCLINLIPLYISIVELILFKIFIRQNPALLAVTEEGVPKLKPYYSQFYSEQDVDKAVQNCIRQFKNMQSMHSYVNKNRGQIEKQQATKIYNRLINLVLLLSFQVSTLRQLCGVNYIGPYAVYVFENLHFEYSAFGPVVMNGLLVFSTIAGMFICHRFPRRPLLLIGSLGAFIGVFTMAMCNLHQNYVGVLIGQIIFTIFDGSMLQPTTWSYPPQINYLSKLPLSNIVSWGSGCIIASTSVVQNSYPIFFFFSGYIFINLILFTFTARQIKNITFREHLTRLMQQAYEQVRIRKEKLKNPKKSIVIKQQLLAQNQTQGAKESSNMETIQQQKQN